MNRSKNRINESNQGMESRNRIKESNQGIESKKPIKSLKTPSVRVLYWDNSALESPINILEFPPENHEIDVLEG